MRHLLSALVAFVLTSVAVTAVDAAGPDAPSPPAGNEHRIAFVVGNESYADGALPTAANDAGLIAQTLQAAGFEVVGARDLDAETLRQSYGDFLKKVADAGPDTVAFVYLSGYGLQYGTDNYYVPIGAKIARDADIPIETIRLSDLTGPLVTQNLKARFMVFDAAYKPPFKIEGAPLAGGFSLIDAGPGTLIAYNAAPGTVAPVGKENYGLYAQSLAAMLREGGLPPDEIFDRVRLRVNDQSKGAEVPWDSSKLDAAFRFFDRGKEAPPPAATPEQTAALTDKPLKDLPVQQAYTAAVARDTVQSYTDFTATYGDDPLAKRARVLLAARREAITWRRTASVDTPDAYWSYLSRYPKGPHADDARLRLQALSAAEAPPQDYQAIAYDVPPPPPDEIDYVDQPVVYFDDPEFADYPPPPPPPDYWLPPVPVAFLDLPPPPPPIGLFFLPVPAFVPLPIYFAPPPFVVYPVNNIFYGGFGPGVPYDRRIDVNSIHQGFPAGGPPNLAERVGPGLRGAAVGAAVGAAAVALPAAALARTRTLEQRGITTPAQLNAARTQPGGLGALNRPSGPVGTPAERNALPGAGNRPLPTVNGKTPGGAPTNALRPAETPRPGANRLGETPGAPRQGAPVRPGAVQNQLKTNAQPGAPSTPTPQQKAIDRRNAIQQQQQQKQEGQQRLQQERAGQQQRLQQQKQESQQRLQQQKQESQQRLQQERAGQQQQRLQQERAGQQQQRLQQERAGQQQRLQQERQQREQTRPQREAPPRAEPRAPQQMRPPAQQFRGGPGGGGPGPRPGGFGGGGPRPGGFGGGGGPRPGGGGGGGFAAPRAPGGGGGGGGGHFGGPGGHL